MPPNLFASKIATIAHRLSNIKYRESSIHSPIISHQLPITSGKCPAFYARSFAQAEAIAEVPIYQEVPRDHLRRGLQKIQIFSNIFKRFASFFEYFQTFRTSFRTFSNIFERNLRIWSRFYLPQPAQSLHFNLLTLIFNLKTSIPPKKISPIFPIFS